jgi:hypothetical protein
MEDYLVAKARRLIDRATFRPHKYGGVAGVVTTGGKRFECSVKTESADVERAWENAELLLRLVLDRFATIERRVRSDLVPNIDHWTSEKVSLAELARRTTAAMRASKTVVLNVTDTDSEAIFDGPDFVRGHAVSVVVNKDGRIFADH